MAKKPPEIAVTILMTLNTGIKISNPTILGRIRKFAELIPITSNASICSVTRIVPNSLAILEPIFPERMRHMIEEENSRNIISRLAYPMVKRGMSGEFILIVNWIVITVPMKKLMITTIHIESSPYLAISRISCLKKMPHFFGRLKTCAMRSVYSPMTLSALLIGLAIA